MLTRLSISNYALIEEVNVSFDETLNIITGETGAGKSIMIGALGLINGNRADFSVLKNAEKKCVVEAEFQLNQLSLEKEFEARELDYDDITIVRREILPNGKSRAFVNDTPVNLPQLKWLGDQLLDIHSQHQTQLLNTETFQLHIIDAAADTASLLQKYDTSYSNWSAAKSHLEELKSQELQNKEDQEYVQFQFEELDKAKLTDLNLVELISEQQTLEKSEEIIQTLNEVNNLLQESDVNVVGQINTISIGLNSLGKINASLLELSQRMNVTLLELSDLAQEISKSAEDIQVDPERLLVVTEQLDLVQRLQLKHKVNEIEELIALRDQLEERLLKNASLDQSISKALAQEKASYELLESTGNKLHKKRKASTEPLAQEVHDFLCEMGMENAYLKVAIEKRSLPQKNGFDDIQMLFSANKGLPFQPINKVASGGELSRVMLAFKSILAKQVSMPTIIFDEIDTGVSGEVAFKMGKRLKQMSEDLQVISITHLPQIASRGSKHFKVIKDHSQDVTNSKIITLNTEDRIVEIASMLSGNVISEHALNNAKELLNYQD